MQSLHYADHGPLVARLSRLTGSEDQIRQIITAAGLRPERISLPPGAWETQWWKALEHANAHGSAALARLLSCAVRSMPALGEQIPGMLQRYGVELAPVAAPAAAPKAAAVGSSASPLGSEARRGASTGPDPAPVRRRILFLSANSPSNSALDIEEEAHKLDGSLREALHREVYDFRTELAVRPRDLADILRRHKRESGRRIVLHFSGHGTHHGPGLRMRADDGRDPEVSPTAFGKLVKSARDTLELVVLNACHSEAHAREAAAHVSAAVGMAEVIGDKSAILFSQVFYRAWASGEDAAAAFDEACLAIELESLPGPDVPVLYWRGEDGALLRRRGAEDEGVADP